MPKIKKVNKREQEYQKEKEKLQDLKRTMFSTVVKGLGMGAIFLILSLLFNGNIIPLTADAGTALDVVYNVVKAVVVILFFAFTLLAWANSQELKGKPLGIVGLIILVVLALIQTVRNVYVFWISLLGILILVFYLWIVQVKVESI